MGRPLHQRIADGWTNVLTGMGIKNRDKKQSTNFSLAKVLTQQEETDLMRGDGFGKKIIEIVPHEMLREGWAVSGDTENTVGKYFNKLDLKKNLLKLLKWDRAFGGAVLVMGLDDGSEDLEQPLNVNALKNIRWFRVFDRYAVDKTTNKVLDHKSERFGLPEKYGITPSNGSQFFVHHSRVWEMSGQEVPERSKQQNAGWGDSVLQSLFTQLENLGTSYHSVAAGVEDWVQGILHVEGLDDKIAMDNGKMIQERLDLMDITRHIINTVVVDTEEKFERITTNFSGIREVLDAMFLALSGVSYIPMRLLVGDTAEGLNNKGEAATRDWYDFISTKQEDQLLPLLTFLVGVAGQASEPNLQIPEDFEITFNPLWQPTQKEWEEIRKLVAERDAIYLDRNVLEPEEVTVSRFGGEVYSTETVIDPNADRGDGNEGEGDEGEGGEGA